MGTGPDRPPTDMLGALLGFGGRIGRGRYLVGLAIASVILFAAAASFATAMNPTGGGSALLAIPLFLIFVWMLVALGVKRFRDAGRSPAFVILQIGLIVLLIYPGLEFAEMLWPLLLAGLIFALTFPAFATGPKQADLPHA